MAEKSVEEDAVSAGVWAERAVAEMPTSAKRMEKESVRPEKFTTAPSGW
jgi:hypothetical protein